VNLLIAALRETSNTGNVQGIYRGCKVFIIINIAVAAAAAEIGNLPRAVYLKK